MTYSDRRSAKTTETNTRKDIWMRWAFHHMPFFPPDFNIPSALYLLHHGVNWRHPLQRYRARINLANVRTHHVPNESLHLTCPLAAWNRERLIMDESAWGLNFIQFRLKCVVEVGCVWSTRVSFCLVVWSFFCVAKFCSVRYIYNSWRKILLFYCIR